nr:Chain A, Islet amyloid polypeptide [synthetic construct]
SNNFGAILSS